MAELGPSVPKENGTLDFKSENSKQCTLIETIVSIGKVIDVVLGL